MVPLPVDGPDAVIPGTPAMLPVGQDLRRLGDPAVQRNRPEMKQPVLSMKGRRSGRQSMVPVQTVGTGADEFRLFAVREGNEIDADRAFRIMQQQLMPSFATDLFGLRRHGQEPEPVGDRFPAFGDAAHDPENQCVRTALK